MVRRPHKSCPRTFRNMSPQTMELTLIKYPFIYFLTSKALRIPLGGPDTLRRRVTLKTSSWDSIRPPNVSWSWMSEATKKLQTQRSRVRALLSCRSCLFPRGLLSAHLEDFIQVPQAYKIIFGGGTCLLFLDLIRTNH